MQKQKLQILLLALMLVSSTGQKCIEFEHSSQNPVLDYKPILPFAFRISKCPSARDVLFVVVDIFRHSGQFREFCHFGHEDMRCNFSSKPGSCQCDDEPQQLYTVYKNVSADDTDLKWRIIGRSRADQKLFAETQRFTVRHLPSVEFLQASVTGADQTTSVVLATVPEHSKLTLRCLWKPGYPPTDAKLVWNGLSLDAVQSAPLGNMTKHLEYNVEDMPCLQGGVDISCRASNARRNESLHLTVLCKGSTVPDNPLSSASSSQLQTTVSTTEHRVTFDDSTANPVSMKVDEDDASQSFAHTTILYIVVGCIFFLLFVVSVVFGILFHRKVLSPRPKPALPSHLNFDDEPDIQEAFDLRQLPARFRNFPGNPASTHSSSSDTYATIDHSTTTLDSSRSIEECSETERGSDPGNLHAMASAAAMGATPDHFHTREVAFDSDNKLVFHPSIGGRICQNERRGVVCQNERDFGFSHQSGGFVSDSMKGGFDFDQSGRDSPRFDPNRKQIGFDHSGRQRVFDRGRGIAGLDPHSRRIVFENELPGPSIGFSSERNVGVRIVHHCKPPPEPLDTSDSDYLHPVASRKNKPAAGTLEQEGEPTLLERKLSADQFQHGRDASLQGAVIGTCTCGNHHLHIPYPDPAFEDAVTHYEEQPDEACQSGERNPVGLLADPQSEAMFHSAEDDSLQGAVGGACACGTLHLHSHQADPIFAHQQQTPVVGWPKFHTTTVPFLGGEDTARMGDSVFPESACQPMFTCLSTSLGHSAGSLLSFTQSQTRPGSSVELMGAVPFIAPRVQAVNTTPRMHHLQRHSKPRLDRFQGDSLPPFCRFEKESLPPFERAVREPMPRMKRSDESESVMSSISQPSTDSDGYLQPGKSIFKRPRNRRAAVATKKKAAPPVSRDEAEAHLSLGVPKCAFDRPTRSALSKLPAKTKPPELPLVMKRSDTADVHAQFQSVPTDVHAPFQSVPADVHAPFQSVPADVHAPFQSVPADVHAPFQSVPADVHAPIQSVPADLHAPFQSVQADVHAPFQSVSSSTIDQEQQTRKLDTETVLESLEGANFGHAVHSALVESQCCPASKPLDAELSTPYQNIDEV